MLPVDAHGPLRPCSASGGADPGDVSALDGPEHVDFLDGVHEFLRVGAETSTLQAEQSLRPSRTRRASQVSLKVLGLEEVRPEMRFLPCTSASSSP